MAQDKGFPPLSRTVEVQIDVVDRANNPPVWDHVVYGPIYIRENLPVGAKVVSVKARCVCNCSARAPHAAPSPARSVRRRGSKYSLRWSTARRRLRPLAPYPRKRLRACVGAGKSVVKGFELNRNGIRCLCAACVFNNRLFASHLVIWQQCYLYCPWINYKASSRVHSVLSWFTCVQFKGLTAYMERGSHLKTFVQIYFLVKS